MKSIKLIALSLVMMLGVFCAVLYSSCQKNGCSGVTCLNEGSCGGGLCSCKTGIGGANCETIYRNFYVGTYTGNATYYTTIDSTDSNVITGKIDTFHATQTTTYANNTLVFSGTDTTNYENAVLVWNNGNGTQVISTNITLANNSATGSTFSFTPISSTVKYDTTNYPIVITGSGSVNGTNATLNLLQLGPHDTTSIVITLNCTHQ